MEKGGSGCDMERGLEDPSHITAGGGFDTPSPGELVVGRPVNQRRRELAWIRDDERKAHRWRGSPRMSAPFPSLLA